MEIFAISGLVNGIIATTFGVMVISKNWRELGNRIYFLMTMSLALWSFSYWQWLLTDSHDIALYWVKILSIGSLFIPIFFFHWVSLLLKIDKGINRAILWGIYLFSFLVLAFSNSMAFIASVGPRSFFLFWPTAGPLYDLYFSYIYIGLVTYTLYLLIRSYFLSHDPQKKGQILYIIFGSVLGFGGGLSNFPLWFGIPWPPYGNFLVAAFPLLLGYSVLRYKLFNAKTIATELLVFFISISLLIEAAVSTTLAEGLLHWGFFVVVTIFGYILIRSVYREVDQREKIERLAGDLEKANVRLTELDRQKSEFVSFATHQLRAPLTAMKGYGSLLLEGDMGKLPSEAREGVRRIYDSTNTLVSIVDDYLNISRIELGSMKYAFETVDLRALIEDTLAELKPNIEKSGLELSFTAEGNGTDYRTTADRDKLKQVIANVIDNSMKYTPSGSIAIRLALDHARHKFILTVKDTGVGISPETLPLLFQKFSRAENANKVNIRGTGLGLFVAKEMIEAHHGAIRAESLGEGKGSTFIVELEPFAKA